MIDDNKIEEAAHRFATSQTHGELLALIDGYKEGFKDAINEFLKDLWHPIEEKPDKEKTFLYQTSYGGFGLNQISDIKDWNFIIKYQKATKWLYIEDLIFKQKGGNHD